MKVEFSVLSWIMGNGEEDMTEIKANEMVKPPQPEDRIRILVLPLMGDAGKISQVSWWVGQTQGCSPHSTQSSSFSQSLI